jgi:hypothetical protein
MSIKEEREAAIIQVKACQVFAEYALTREAAGWAHPIRREERADLAAFLEGKEIDRPVREKVFSLLSLLGE